MMNDVMTDLETLGTSAGCAIVSFGAIAFDEYGTAGAGFYQPVRVADYEKPGLTPEGLRKEEGTIAWWQQQSEQARAVFTDDNAVPLGEAFHRFGLYMAKLRSARVWGNGADFDLPIITAAGQAVGAPPLWKPYNGRCYRTVKNQYQDVKLARVGTYHNALDDARSQAMHMMQICQTRGWRLA